MDNGDTKRRLAAILAADVIGYSKLMGADEMGTLRALKRHREDLFEPAVVRNNGRTFKLIGDGTLVEFASVVDAVKCAVEIQNAIAGQDASQTPHIRLRIGINLGDVIIDGEDVYGDGVNVAARLEPLADHGGVCVSSIVRESVGGRLDVTFDDGGEVSVKNISRPVRLWKWRPDGVVEGNPETHTAVDSVARTGKTPSIVVVPFVNMSGDSEHEFFADGITEDIITELSRFPDLFIIGRNSAFAYKGRDLLARDIARELEVEYVVSGSVRHGTDRVRVSVQMTDAATGKQIYAERFDREMADIFDLQDDLTRSIVASLPEQVRRAETQRVRRMPPHSLAAYECLLAGRLSHHQCTADDNSRAVTLLDRAIELDPDYASAWAWKACVLGQSLQFGFVENLKGGLQQAMEAAQHALRIDENDVECHRLLCEFYMFYHKLDQAAPHGDRAIALNPNDPRIVAQHGELLTWRGSPDEGADWIGKAAKLDPYGAPGRAHLLGRALYGARRYDEAVQAYRSKSTLSCGQRAELAASLAQSGKRDEAAEVVDEMAQSCVDFSVDEHVDALAYAKDEDRAHMRDGLTKAGLW